MLCSKIKYTEKLRGYRTTYLCLCLHICKKQVFHDAANILGFSDDGMVLPPNANFLQ